MKDGEGVGQLLVHSAKTPCPFGGGISMSDDSEFVCRLQLLWRICCANAHQPTGLGRTGKIACAIPGLPNGAGTEDAQQLHRT